MSTTSKDRRSDCNDRRRQTLGCKYRRTVLVFERHKTQEKTESPFFCELEGALDDENQTFSAWDVVEVTSFDEAIDHIHDADCLVVNAQAREARDFLHEVRSCGTGGTNTPLFLLCRDGEDCKLSAATMKKFAADGFFDTPYGGSPRELREAFEAAYRAAMVKQCHPRLETEYGPLETVLVHRPCEELNRVDPDDSVEYLLEMPIYIKPAQRQHAEFVKRIRLSSNRPVVLYVTRLLYEIVKQADLDHRREILKKTMLHPELLRLLQISGGEEDWVSSNTEMQLHRWAQGTPVEIVKRILSGASLSELRQEADGDETHRRQQIVLPVANLHFTRDPAFVLGNQIFLSRMFWPVRRRETPILRLIFNEHPFFAEQEIRIFDNWRIDKGNMRSTEYDEKWTEPEISVEGGDVMAIEAGYYAVAESERTNRQAIEKIAGFMLRKKSKKVYHPKIPVKRSFIHLDTVCSLTGPDRFVVHRDAIEAYPKTYVWSDPDEDPVQVSSDFIKILKGEFHRDQITAPPDIRDRKEQRGDAVNVLMVSPTEAVAYEENIRTNKAMRDAGLTVITFEGTELGKGLGGPRCMTMPIRRGSV